MSFRIELEPVGRRAEVEAGQTLLEAAQRVGVELVSLCGGVGNCDSCRVRLVQGQLTPPTLEEQAAFSAEELSQGFRLACQAVPLSDVKIDIPPESLTTPQRLQVEGLENKLSLDLPVEILAATVPPPTLDDLRADVTRLQEAVVVAGQPALQIDLSVLAGLSDQLRAQRWQARLVRRGAELVAMLPAAETATHSGVLGLAVDIGTTKLAAYLLDMLSGHTLAQLGAMNPQIGYGEDVVSRILFCNEHTDGRQTLQTRLVETLNGMVGELCTQAGASREQIVEMVAVGNTAMHHLFAGLPVQQLGASPYVPAVSAPIEFRASAIGLKLAPGAMVYLPANIAGYVGADHVAMVLATGLGAAMDDSETGVAPRRAAIALDIGTNTEISLAYRDASCPQGQLLCCSCASGPAFEGAHIHDGMRAAPGAVERVQLVHADKEHPSEVRIHTIGNRPAVGICGSGILDAVAQMLSAGLLDGRGNLHNGHPRVRIEGKRRELVLVPAEQSGHGRDVVVTRKDVNEIQLAKGAIRAGVDILCEAAGITSAEIDDFIVAGAFGTYLDIDSAVRVGMFPALPRQRFRQVGNAAGAGARQMLVSRQRREQASEIASRDRYIELTAYPDFTEHFMRALMFESAAKEV